MFLLPLTVLAPDPVDLVIEARSPLPWGEVRAAVCAGAGLPAGAALHHGFGPVPDEALLGSPPLLAGCELRLHPTDSLPELPLLHVVALSGPDAGLCVPVGTAPIGIGRAPTMTFCLTDSAASWRHATLVPGPDGVRLHDADSTNGVYVEGRPLEDAEVIPTGTIFRIGSTVFQLRLALPPPPGGFVPDGLGHLVRAAATSPAPAPQPTLVPPPKAPEKHPRRALPWISAAVGGGLGVVLAVVLHHPMFLAFAALGPVTMLGTALGDRLRGRRSYRAEQRAFREECASWEQTAETARQRYRRALWAHWPGPAALISVAEAAGARLWSIRLADPDYLSVAVGSQTTAEIADLPQITPLGGVIGFVGAAGRAQARWVIAQLLALHSPQDLAITMISPKPDLACARDLVHDPDDLPADRDIAVILDGREAIARGLPPTPPGARHVMALCLVDEARDLPPGAHTLPVHSDAATALSPDSFARLCRALTPLRERAATALPRHCTLSGTAGPLNTAATRHRWSSPSTRITIGAGPTGPVGFDLAADGPHLLIAGTTGSGKSELLQTIITSLALAAPPTDLTMLLVDYKGGAAFGPLATLPHVVGVVTDLDPALSARALASLRAELHRRERIAAADGPREPRLVIVIDEFATLAAELPDFLAGLLDIAQRGRSLGVHLILATQRPAGIVSPAMRANIPLRICLRVIDPADSRDVIGIADAAGISATTPGRAFLTTGSQTQIFQTARVTAPQPPALTVRRRGNPPTPAKGPTDAETVLALTRALSAHLPTPRTPWLPPLPDRIAPDGYDDTLALVDLPDEQRQEALSAPAGSLLVVGPTRSGRTTTLRRIAMLAAGQGEEILVVDGAAALADLAEWSAVSTYLDLRDPHLVLRLLTLLADPTRRPNHPRHLIIDHYDLVVSALERADFATGSTALTDLLATAAVRMTVSGPEAVAHGRLRGRFPDLLELGGAPPGRARWAAHDIQLIDCPPAHPPLATCAPRPDATVVRPLPDHVAPIDLPDPTPHAIPVGIGGDAVRPVTIDLAGTGGAILVGGPRGAGVSTCIAAIARGAAEAGIPVWTVPRDPEALRAALADLSGPVLLTLDDAAPDHPAADLLDRFLSHCGPGQNLLIGTTTPTLARARSGFLAAAMSYRKAILLSPEPGDGTLFDLRLPRREGRIIPGRGLYLAGNERHPVQLSAAPSASVTAPTPTVS